MDCLGSLLARLAAAVQACCYMSRSTGKRSTWRLCALPQAPTSLTVRRPPPPAPCPVNPLEGLRARPQASAAWNAEFLDSAAAYCGVPLALGLDVCSAKRADGIQYRLGLHQARLPCPRPYSTLHAKNPNPGPAPGVPPGAAPGARPALAAPARARAPAGARRSGALPGGQPGSPPGVDPLAACALTPGSLKDLATCAPARCRRLSDTLSKLLRSQGGARLWGIRAARLRAGVRA
jgi:hypothetical protein